MFFGRAGVGFLVGLGVGFLVGLGVGFLVGLGVKLGIGNLWRILGITVIHKKSLLLEVGIDGLYRIREYRYPGWF